MNVIEDLKKFMLNDIAAGMGKTSLENNEDLLEQGIIDSLGVMKLITFMEDTFKLRIDDEEIVPENFQCLNSMVGFIEAKRQSAE